MMVKTLKNWWSQPQFEQAAFADEVQVVCEEIANTSKGVRPTLARRLLPAIFPKSYLSTNFEGTPETVRTLSPKDLAQLHKRLRKESTVMLALGPMCPWIEAEQAEQNTIRVPAELCTNLPHVPRFQLNLCSGKQTKTFVWAVLKLPGLQSSERLLGELLLATFLHRLHPTQHYMNDRLSLRFISYGLKSYAASCLFEVFAMCPSTATKSVAEQIQSMLTLPLLEERRIQSYNALRAELNSKLDDPGIRLKEEAIRALYGIPSLEEDSKNLANETNFNLDKYFGASHLFTPHIVTQGNK